MCVIVDNDVQHQVFGNRVSPAGEYFADRIDNKRRRLATGGENLRELRQHQAFRNWARTAQRYGYIRSIPSKDIDERTGPLSRHDSLTSNDAHVIALGIVSGARLLFTNDQKLQDDFTGPHFIKNPRGRVYTTVKFRDIRQAHRDLLGRRDLCAWSDCGK